MKKDEAMCGNIVISQLPSDWKKSLFVLTETDKKIMAALGRRGCDSMSEFPERLRKLRERKRIKRYVLSERCGLHLDAIRRYETGESKPTMDALASIADEFGVTVDYLMGRTDYPYRVDIREKNF